MIRMTDSADMVRGSGCYAHDLSFIACRMRLEQRRPKDHDYRMLSDAVNAHKWLGF